MKPASKKSPKKPQGKLSPEGRKKITAALKARWVLHKTPAKSVTLEVMPKEGDQLAACVEQIRELQFTINEKTRDLIYDIVATGVYFLKLRDLHLMQGHKQLVETVSTSEDGEQGFLKIIEREFCRRDITDEDELKKHVAAQQRSARNYMNAARNANLTGDHSLEDVHELRERGVLDGKKATDLYKLTDKAKPTKLEENEPAPDLAANALSAFAEAAEEVRILKEQMTDAQWEMAVSTAKNHIEALTDCTWENAGHGVVIDGHEHGDMTLVPAGKNGGGKNK